jgi:hypothetical protein
MFSEYDVLLGTIRLLSVSCLRRKKIEMKRAKKKGGGHVSASLKTTVRDEN